MKLFRKKGSALSEHCESKGFTLIELLLVVGIIMVLAALVIVSVSKARARSRDGKRIADLSTIQLAMEMYKDSKGTYYPPECYNIAACGNPPTGGVSSCPASCTNLPAWGRFVDSSNSSLPTMLNSYLSPIPQDPIKNNDKYKYQIWMGSTQYFIRARVEDQDNANMKKEATLGNGNFDTLTWCYYLMGGKITTEEDKHLNSDDAFCN